MNDTPARSVILAMTLSALTFITAHGLAYVTDEAGIKRVDNPFPQLGGIETFIAWGFILTVLIVLADIPATGELGAAFAWLFFLAVLFSYGGAAFANLLAMMGVQSGQPATTAGGGTQIPSHRNPVAE